MAAISIIVPIYNVEKYLNQCLDSILSQTFTDIEIVLVDDGSTDGCYKICEDYKEKDSRIVVIHQKNEGLVSARKTGINFANGEYIAYVDGDDWIEPDMYEHMYKEMIHQSVDIVMCGRFEDTGKVSKVVYHEMQEGKYDKEALVEKVYPRLVDSDVFFGLGLIPSIWDKLFRRKCVEHFQMMVDNRVSMGEDAACVYLSLLNADSIYIMHKCFYHYRQTTTSMIKQVKCRSIERKQFQVLYKTVNNNLKQYKHIYDLGQTWKKYILSLMIPRADGLYNNYEELDYLFPFSKVKKGYKIVLYGAGTYGQRLYCYLLKTQFCRVVAWVDRNYSELQKIGLKVQSPSVLIDMEYDAIVIANIFASSRHEIYQELIMKYSKDKVQVFDEELILSNETAYAFGILED